MCVEMERDRVMDVVDVWMDVGDNSKDENRELLRPCACVRVCDWIMRWFIA